MKKLKSFVAKARHGLYLLLVSAVKIPSFSGIGLGRL